MAFKSVKEYNENKFNGFFLLRNDGDYADVILMYRSEADVLVADTHYIKSADYTGYVHCCGKGCPACAKGIRVQTKLFIPVYNLREKKLQIWDRTLRFEPQLHKDIFSNFANPSEYIFRIIRHGEAGSVDTTYEFMIHEKRAPMTYDAIMQSLNTCSPDCYEVVCKSVTSSELYQMLNSSSISSVEGGDLPNYQVTPRTRSNPIAPDFPTVSSDLPEIPELPDMDDLDTSSMQSVNNETSEYDELDDDDVVF